MHVEVGGRGISLKEQFFFRGASLVGFDVEMIIGQSSVKLARQKNFF